MKKILLYLMMVCALVSGAKTGHADDVTDVIVFQYNGKNYYYNDIDKLRTLFESLIKVEPCLQNQDGITVDTMLGALISVCRQRRTTLDMLIKDRYKADSSVKPILGSWGVDNRWDNLHSKENALKACVVDVETLAQDLKKLKRDRITLGIGVDLDACINGIRIDPDLYVKDLYYNNFMSYGEFVTERINYNSPEGRHHVQTNKMCPLDITVQSEADLANVRNLNQEYGGRTFTFMDTYVKPEEVASRIGAGLKVDTVMVFNGSMLVACQGGRAMQMGHPVYSGYNGCYGQDSQGLSGFGSLPDGVYLMNVGKDEMGKPGVQNLYGTDKEKGWGKYRIPLRPSVESKTYGRNNFYLHGTLDPQKRRSGGCITLGLNIDDFIETAWFQEQIKVGKYMLVIVKNQLKSGQD